MKWTFFALLVAAALVAGVAVNAQNGEAAECDLEIVKTEYTEQITDAEDWDSLATILNDFRSTVAACAEGYTWSGYASGLLGPVDLEQGVYVVEYLAEIDAGDTINYFIGHLISVADESESEEYFIDDDVPGDEDREGEIIQLKSGTTLRLNGGTYLIQIESLNFRDWEVRLYKVG